MRVLVISATFPPMQSGGADYAFRYCQQLADAGMDVHVVTSAIENVVTSRSMRVYPIMRRWSWAELPRLLKIARCCNPDVVNLHFQGAIYKNHPMVTFAPTLMKRLLPHAKMVTHIESPGGARIEHWPRVTHVVRRAVARWAGTQGVDYGFGTILRDSERIIILSESHRAILAKHFAAAGDKCVLIPPPSILPVCAEVNGQARRRGRQLLQISSDEFLLAYFGYIYPFKGIETLLRAFQIVAQHRTGVRLVLIGGSNEVMLRETNRPNYVQELKDLSQELNIAERVVWTGYYPTESDRASLYLRSADACVLPFDNGVYMNNSSFTSAAAHGLPIITTEGEILESQIINGKNALLCLPQEPQALASAIDWLIDNAELRRRLSDGALELAREWFSWEKATQRTIDTFKEN